MVNDVCSLSQMSHKYCCEKCMVSEGCGLDQMSHDVQIMQAQVRKCNMLLQEPVPSE